MIGGFDTCFMSTLSTTPFVESRSNRAAGSRHHNRGFWIVALTFMTAMAFAAAPAPLYPLYQQRSGFTPFMITIIFAAYAVGVAISLFLAGHISDRFGRRRILVPTLILLVIAALIFMVWPALPGLLLARFISGLGIGMLTATATAHMTELHAEAQPGSGSRKPEVISTAANIGGLGFGPLISGILADVGSAPLYTIYVVFAFALLIGLLLITLVPETVELDSTWSYRPQRVVIPAESRSTYFAAGLMAFVGFAMFGFFTSLAPGLIAGTLHISSHTVSGLAAFAVFFSAAVFQVVSSRWARTRQYLVGLLALAIGLAIVVAGVLLASLAGLLVGGIIVGAGVGITFKAALGTVVSIAPAQTRGEALAGLFLAGYLGMAVPVLLLGLSLLFAPLTPSVLLFGLLMLVLLAVTAVTLRRTNSH